MVKPNCLGLECNRIFAFYLKIPNCMYVKTIFCIFQRKTHQSLALMLPFETSIVVTILIGRLKTYYTFLNLDVICTKILLTRTKYYLLIQISDKVSISHLCKGLERPLYL